MISIADRKKQEKDFHNYFRGVSSNGRNQAVEYYASNKKWYVVNQKSRNFEIRWLNENCRDKTVLDYCCGNGEMALLIAKAGAKKTIGIDISDVSIENAKMHAKKNGCDTAAEFFVMDAENITFEDNYFDIVHINGVLHHLDLRKAYRELSRVLKEDGKIICTEALGYNMAIQLYREITPHLRTKYETEHILKRKDIWAAREFFKNVEILGFFHLFSILAVPFRKNTLIFNNILNILNSLDSIFLKLPIFKWQAWIVVFMLSGPLKKAHARGNEHN